MTSTPFTTRLYSSVLLTLLQTDIQALSYRLLFKLEKKAAPFPSRNVPVTTGGQCSKACCLGAVQETLCKAVTPKVNTAPLTVEGTG